MRLFEVEDSFARDLEMLLRNQRDRSDSKKSTLTFSYDAISNMMKNMGHGKIELDDVALKNLIDGNPALKSVIKNFNKYEVEVSTEKEEPETGDAIPQPGGQTVDSMASQAANQFLNSPLS